MKENEGNSKDLREPEVEKRASLTKSEHGTAFGKN